MQHTFRALLVGVNQYANLSLPQLQGCVNDVRLLESALRQRFHVVDENIRRLLDTQATHLAIKRAFRDHLIEPAKCWATAGQPEPAPIFLFHFSGHGSRAKDPSGTKANGLDETIVPHDSRTEGVFDIKDWELGALLEELGRYTQEVTVILDCCHSGSGTRDTELATRQCEPDWRDQPPLPVVAVSGTRGNMAASATAAASHVLLAACSNTQVANEYREVTTAHVTVYGAMSYAVASELSKPLGPALTYRDFHQQISRQVRQWFPQQTPQCEGDRDRVLFSGLRPSRELWISVTHEVDGRHWIDAGAVHGLEAGVELEAYAPGTNSLVGDPQSLGTLRLEILDAIASGCVLITGGSVPVSARLRPLAVRQQDLIRTVQLQLHDPELLSTVQQRLCQTDLQGFVRQINTEQADFTLIETAGGLLLEDSQWQGLSMPLEPVLQADLLAQALRKWVRYKNALHIENRSPSSQLGGTVQVLMQHVSGPPLETETAAVPVIHEGTTVRFELKNCGQVPLYLSALSFGYDGSISPLWPTRSGEHIAIEPGNSVSTGAFRLGFATGEPRSTVREFVKVFATRTATEFDVLHMDGTGHAPGTRATPTTLLGRFLQQARAGSGQRLLQPVETRESEDWTTAEFAYALKKRSL